MLVTNAHRPDVRVQREALALAEAGHPVRVVAWDRAGELAPRETRDGVEVVRVGAARGEAAGYGRGLAAFGRGLPGYWRAAARVEAAAATAGRPADVLHAHDLDTLPLALWLARGRGGAQSRPVVFDAHEHYPDYAVQKPSAPRGTDVVLRAVERRLVRRAAAVVTVGPSLAGHYEALGAARVEVVGNWQDPDRFRFADDELDAERAALGLGGFEGVVVVYGGSLGPNRAVVELVEAARDRPDVRVVIAGDGVQRDAVAAACAAASNATYLGRVDDARNRRLKALGDVVWRVVRTTVGMPGSRWAAPNNLYEALASGSAFVATRTGDIPAVVDAEGCGVLVDDATPASLAASLDAVTDRPRLAAMQAAAARAGRERYSWPVAAQRLVSLYARLG